MRQSAAVYDTVAGGCAQRQRVAWCAQSAGDSASSRGCVHKSIASALEFVLNPAPTHIDRSEPPRSPAGRDELLAELIERLMSRARRGEPDGLDEVVLWGTGTPRREFLHVDDLGRAVVHLLDGYDSPETINVGTGNDLTIRELAEMVADVVGFVGDIVQDTSRPDGTPRKLLDVTRIRATGWEPRIELRDGIESTYAWFCEHRSEARLGD